MVQLVAHADDHGTRLPNSQHTLGRISIPAGLQPLTLLCSAVCCLWCFSTPARLDAWLLGDRGATRPTRDYQVVQANHSHATSFAHWAECPRAQQPARLLSGWTRIAMPPPRRASLLHCCWAVQTPLYFLYTVLCCTCPAICLSACCLATCCNVCDLAAAAAADQQQVAICPPLPSRPPRMHSCW
jgi:hypothetical protein